MSFGQKLKRLREERGISQQELAKKLGYTTNSYISEVESGDFLPSERKLNAMAKALGTSLTALKNLLIESRLEALGINDPAFLSLFKDYPRLTREDKRAIMKAYLKIKRAKEKR